MPMLFNACPTFRFERIRFEIVEFRVEYRNRQIDEASSPGS
jgi:hypothetical protein